MGEMDLLWILWLWILPMFGVCFILVVPTFWFFIVPKVARRLTWGRFRNSTVLAIGDDAGYVDLVVTAKSLPEGILQTEKHGFRFLPRVKYSKEKKDANKELVEYMATRKYMLKDYGKPFWYVYDGKVLCVNPPTLASLEASSTHTHNPNPSTIIAEIKGFLETVPQHLSEPLREKIAKLEQLMKETAKDIKILDPKIVKEVLPQMVTPSQIDALATNRETYGAKKTGREYGKLIIGGAIILGLVVLGIVAMTFLLK